MRFSEEDKALTDHLQEVFPEWLPEKPAPKVYLTPDMIHTIWEYAKKQNIDSDAIYRVLHYWCRGYRYHKAVSAYMLRYNETIKNTLDLLKKDYPKLFSAPNKPLKLDIDKDLIPWCEAHGISGEAIKVTLQYWTSQKKYRRAVSRSNCRYDLDNNKTPKNREKELEV